MWIGLIYLSEVLPDWLGGPFEMGYSQMGRLICVGGGGGGNAPAP
jgi:hypothetical protein